MAKSIAKKSTKKSANGQRLCALAAWRDLRGWWLAMVQRPHRAYPSEHRLPGSSRSIDTAQTATVGRVPWQLCIWQRVGCSPNPP